MRATVRNLGAIALALTAGCATFHEQATLRDDPRPARSTRSTEPKGRRYEVATTVNGPTLRLHVTQHDTCDVTTVERVHRTRHVQRTVEPNGWANLCSLGLTSNPIVAEFVVGGGGLGLGGYGLASRDPTSLTASLALGAVGLVGVGLGIADLVRAQDSDDDLGIVDLPPEESRTPCDARVTANEVAGLYLPMDHGRTLSGTTDAHGDVAFSLADEPLPALPTFRTPALLVVGGTQAPVRLDDAAHRRLVEALLADPTTRAGREARSSREAPCYRLASQANALLDAATSPGELDLATPLVTRAHGCADGVAAAGGPLAQALSALDAKRSAAAKRFLDRALSAFRAAGAANAVVETASTALSLADALADARRPTWDAVVPGLARHASDADGWDVLARVVDRHPPTRSCLAKSDGCPAWLGADAVHEALAPAVGAALAHLAAEAGTMKSLGAELSTEVSLDVANRLQSALAPDAFARLACDSRGWDPALDAACGSVTEASASARATLVGARARLHAERVKATAAAWRSEFPKCREVASGLDAVQAVGSCESPDCRSTRSRMLDAQSALRSFAVPDAEWDSDVLFQVRGECRQARCPACP